VDVTGLPAEIHKTGGAALKTSGQSKKKKIWMKEYLNTTVPSSEWTFQVLLDPADP
jgi:hypothetical protein